MLYAQALAKEGIKCFLLSKRRNANFEADKNPDICRVSDWGTVDFDHWGKCKYYLTTAIPYMNGAPHA